MVTNDPSPEPAELDTLAATVARRIFDGFETYYGGFKEIMARSKRRFEARDWAGLQADAQARLLLYVHAVDGTSGDVDQLTGARAHDPELWLRLRKSYDLLAADPANGDLALAYFSTVKRRFIPVDEHDFEPTRWDIAHPQEFVEEVRLLERESGSESIERLLRSILDLFSFETPFVDLAGDVRQAAALIEDRLSQVHWRRPIAVLRPLFYRARRAHIIGRIWDAGRFIPLVIAITNSEAGLKIAEVLLGDEETSSLFSFTRSQFHVVTRHHREMMAFLKSLAPAKSAADLYASVGYNNLSKSALLGDLFRLVRSATERFRLTSGARGTVMIAFELPNSRFVIKVIRDRFLSRRVETSRDKVMRRYRFVQYAERAGRILDIFHFHHVRFEREWFDERVLEELSTWAPSTLQIEGRHVILNEFYAQRKVVPLDVFFHGDTHPSVMRRVVIDLGFLHKELAARNIFTGDVVPNNFGVVSIGKRSQRVVSFDYDGYSRITDMCFRDLYTRPSDPSNIYDDWDAPEDSMVIDEEWDVIPEKFRMTFGVPEAFREEFDRVHGELYASSYWIALQEELRKRPEMLDAFPYALIAR